MNCPTCNVTMKSSGAYHFWCALGHFDLHKPVPVGERAHHCKYCVEPLKDGICIKGCIPAKAAIIPPVKAQVPSNQPRREKFNLPVSGNLFAKDKK